jgi:hypothetical protein
MIGLSIVLAVELVEGDPIEVSAYVFGFVVMGALPALALLGRRTRDSRAVAVVTGLPFVYFALRYVASFQGADPDDAPTLIAYLDHFLAPICWLVVLVHALHRRRQSPDPNASP